MRRIKRNYSRAATTSTEPTTNTISRISSQRSNSSPSLQSRIDAFNNTAPKPRPRKLESELQRTCVRWFRLQYPHLIRLLFAVPNGGSRNVIEARRFKDEGVTAGVSDLILLTPSSNAEYHGLCIEMKTTAASSRQSPEQAAFQTAVEEQGYRYTLIRTFDQFQSAITSHLNQ